MSDSDTPQWENFAEQLYLRSHHNVDDPIRCERLPELFGTLDITKLLERENDPNNVTEQIGKLEMHLPDRVADQWTAHKNPNRVIGALFKRMNGRVTSNGYLFSRACITKGNNKWVVTKKE